jgi:hypothetical protein
MPLRRRNGIRHSKQANITSPAAIPWLFSAWPNVCAVVETVATAVAFPPAANVTLTGESVQTGSLAALAPVTEQANDTLPANPFVDATEMLLVALAPEITVNAPGLAVTVKPGNAACATEITITDEVSTTEPLVPVTVTSRTPAVPAAVLIVSTAFVAEPKLTTADDGASEQLPAAVPLAVVAEQLSATVPAKLLTEATVTESVPLAPAINERFVTAGVTVKLEGAVTTNASPAEVEPVKVLSPEYTAVIWYVPAVGNVSAEVDALPEGLNATAAPSAVPLE